MFIWIWQLEKQVRKYGGINGLIERLKSMGVKDVCIKYHEGSGPIGGGINFKEGYRRYYRNFKDAGFRVGTWGYNYFNHITEESNLIIEALNISDYYIFDPEVDVANKFKQAEEICRRVRNSHPSKLIGYSSFPIVSYHTDIPYSVFNKYCNFASPQVYWGEMEWSVSRCIDRMLSDHKRYGLNKPIYPSIQSYNVSYNSYMEYKKYDFKNTGVWSLDEMQSNCIKFIESCAGKDYIPEGNKPGGGSPSASGSIKDLQSQLNSLINANLVVDGIQGPRTTDAVKRFQSLMGLSEDGIVGTRTWGAIKEIRSYPTDGVKFPHYEYATRWIQWRVGTSIDGIFGPKTEERVKQWQRECNRKYGTNLAIDGIVGKETWRCMFKY